MSPSPDQLRALIADFRREVAERTHQAMGCPARSHSRKTRLARADAFEEAAMRLESLLSAPVEAPRTGEGEPAVNDYLNNGLVFCGYHHRALKDRACPECSSARPRTQGAEG